MKSIIELITVVCVAAIGSNAPPPLLAASPSPFADSKEVSFTSTENEISCTRSDSEA